MYEPSIRQTYAHRYHVSMVLYGLLGTVAEFIISVLVVECQPLVGSGTCLETLLAVRSQYLQAVKSH